MNYDELQGGIMIKYDEQDLVAWHDVIVDTLLFKKIPYFEASWTEQKLMDIYCKLPLHIRSIAEEWTMSDTVFRDNACEWLRENWDIFQ